MLTITFATAYSLQCDRLISIFDIPLLFIRFIFTNGLPSFVFSTSMSFQDIEYLSSNKFDIALKTASFAANLAA